MIQIEITSGPIDVMKTIQSVMRRDCGGIAVFIGTIRDAHDGKTVRKVEVEAYDAMAVNDLKRIAQELAGTGKVNAVSIVHRSGGLDVGDVVVVIAVSAVHRREAFEACQGIIDRLKQTTPIWKQEFFDDGSRWTGEDAH